MNAVPLVRLPIYTNSSLTTFNRCKREYFYSYVMNRRARRIAEALRFGKLFHLGLNAWWRAHPDERLESALAAIHEAGGDEFDIAKAVALMVGYHARWGAQSYETIDVEKRFTIDGISGSIDAIARELATGHVFNVEHKTTSEDISPGGDYVRHACMLDPQVSTYNLASQGLGHSPRYTLYDIIRKPTLRPALATPVELRKYTKPTAKEPKPRLYANMRELDETPEEYGDRIAADIAESPDKYFVRVKVVRLPEDDLAHQADTTETIRAIEMASGIRDHYRSTGQCRRYGRLCSFHEVCSNIASIDDETIFETKKAQHEELA